MTNTIEIFEEEGEREYRISLPRTRVTVKSVIFEDGALDEAEDFVWEDGLLTMDLQPPKKWYLSVEGDVATVDAV